MLQNTKTETQDSHLLQKVIVTRTDHLGDVILSLPVFASLKKCFPNCKTIALVGDYTADAAASSPYVDKVITYTPKEPILATLKKFRSERPDAIVLLFPRFKIAVAGFLARIPIRVGTAYRWYSFLFNKRIHEHRKYSVKNEADYNLNLLEVLGCNEKVLNITLNVNETASKKVDAFLDQVCVSNFVVVHPGTGGSALEWGAANFRELVKNITNTMSMNVIVTGVESERPICKGISEGIGNAINAAGKFSLLEFIALLSKAELVISNSTGPIHLAAAVGTPVIGIYPNKKPMTPVRWAPLTHNKKILTPRNDSDKLSTITVDEVLQATREFLKAGDE
jgi:heptosyltransferase-3